MSRNGFCSHPQYVKRFFLSLLRLWAEWFAVCALSVSRLGSHPRTAATWASTSLASLWPSSLPLTGVFLPPFARKLALDPLLHYKRVHHFSPKGSKKTPWPLTLGGLWVGKVPKRSTGLKGPIRRGVVNVPGLFYFLHGISLVKSGLYRCFPFF